MAEQTTIPMAFIWKRVHSLTGLFITLYLIEHLLVNSQAALFVGEDGSGFVRAVNAIQELPYLRFLEIFLLATPIIIHAIWGIVYLQTSAPNSWPTDGSKPSLPSYPRNRAYTWQRITSWILAFAILAHVIHMRFYEYPEKAALGAKKNYMVRLAQEPALETLAERLDFQIVNQSQIEQFKEKMQLPPSDNPLAKQRYEQETNWLLAVQRRPLKTGQVIAIADNFGTAELLMLRETFKMPLMIVLYTIFVLAACFHGFNGLWTFMISWGFTLTQTAQRWMRFVSTTLMCLVTFLGLAAIWGTYWINLKQ